jgi:hypothetical protein
LRRFFETRGSLFLREKQSAGSMGRTWPAMLSSPPAVTGRKQKAGEISVRHSVKQRAETHRNAVQTVQSEAP